MGATNFLVETVAISTVTVALAGIVFVYSQFPANVIVAGAIIAGLLVVVFYRFFSHVEDTAQQAVQTSE